MPKKTTLCAAILFAATAIYFGAANSPIQSGERIRPSFASADFEIGSPSRYAPAPKQPPSPLNSLKTAALARSEDPAAAFELGEALLARHSAQEAVPYLEKALRLDPEMGSAFYELVGAYLETSTVERGVAFFESLLKDARTDRALAFAALADLKATAGEPGKAVDDAEAARKESPRSATIAALLASVYRQLQDPRADATRRIAENLRKHEELLSDSNAR